MVVRFMPPPGEVPSSSAGDRSDLAEVIELRSLLTPASWRSSEDVQPSDQAENSVLEKATVPGEVETLAEVPAVAKLSALVKVPALAVVPELAEPESEPEQVEVEVEPQRGPERSAHEDGVRLLARKARSSGELRNDLLWLDHDSNDVEEVVAEFEASLYLDDVGLARVLTEKLRDNKRASKSQIRMKLRERKIKDAAIDLALSELDDDDEYALLSQAAKDRARSLQDLDRKTAERRLLGFLARRGWSGEQASKAVRAALDGAGSSQSSGRSSGVRFR